MTDPDRIHELAVPPPEAADVDYDAMRRHIRRTVVQRQWRNRLALPLAVAAGILLIFSLAPRHHEPQVGRTPWSARGALAPPPATMEIAASPTLRPKGHARAARRPAVAPRETDPASDLAAWNRLEHPAPPGSPSPLEFRIATNNPDVLIVLVPETKGEPHE